MTSHQPETLAQCAGRRIYILGAPVELDERISWAPTETTGWQRANVYLLVDSGAALLIDTGFAAHSDVIREQMAQVLELGAQLSVFLTRPQEFASAGSFVELADMYEIGDVFVGGVSSAVDLQERPSPSIRKVVARDGDTIALGANPSLRVLAPPLRLLNNHWVYEPVTATLFTSNAFTHALLSEPTAATVISRVGDEPSLATVRAHLEAHFWWLAHSPGPELVRSLAALLESQPIAFIAPALGCVLSGRELVNRHVALTLDALGGPASPPQGAA